MAQFFMGLFALLGTLRELISISFLIFQFVRAQYERQERKEVVKEIKEGMKESVQGMDSGRLQKALTPPNA